MPYGAMGKIFNIAECTQTLKILMRMVGIDFVVFPPTYVKRVFCGVGNGDKDEMCAAYKDKYGVSISELFKKEELTDSPISDIVDSHAMLYTLFHGDITVAESV